MALDALLVRIVADWLVMPIVLLAGWNLLRIRPPDRRYQLIARAVCAGLVALFFASIASLFYQDGQRPFEQLGVSAGATYLNNPGFPSDHVLFVFTLSGIVWASTKRTTLALGLLAMSGLVAAARVVALVHTPADVVGGAVCATLAVLCMYGRSLWKISPPR